MKRIDNNLDWSLEEVVENNKLSLAYHFKIKNLHETEAKNAEIFGLDRSVGAKENFGSDPDILVTSELHDSYEEALNATEETKETCLIVIESATKEQTWQIIVFNYWDDRGNEATIPIITQSYYPLHPEEKEPLTVARIPYSMKIDKRMKGMFRILPNSEITLKFYE